MHIQNPRYCRVKVDSLETRGRKALALREGRIEKEMDEVRSEEPGGFRKLRLGVVEGGAGTGGQSLFVLVHLEAYLMIDGTHRLSHTPAHSGNAEGGRHHAYYARFLTQNLNHFEFLSDLGPPILHDIGGGCSRAPDTITNPRNNSSG